MSALPTISIIVPSYNQGRFLEETLLSIIGQDYPGLELIVMDGGSKDESVAIIERYASQIDHWTSEPDGGQTDAIATGFERATGEIFFWLASDDLLLPGALQRVGRHFCSHPDADVVTGGCVYINSESAPLTKWGNYTLGVAANYNRFRFYEQDGVPQQATYFRRTAYEKVGGLDRSLSFIMDLDLYTRLAQRGRFTRIPHLLGAFRLHEEGKTNKIQHIRKKEQKAFKRQHGVSDLPTALRLFLYWRYRAPSLLRKSFLYIAQAIGHVRKQRSYAARDWASHYIR